MTKPLGETMEGNAVDNSPGKETDSAAGTDLVLALPMKNVHVHQHLFK